MSKTKSKCDVDISNKKITKVVRDNHDISHIEFIDKSKKAKGCIFYDCSVAGITPVSTARPAGGFSKINEDFQAKFLENPHDIKKDWLHPCTKKENSSIVAFIKDNLKKNKSIMNEETFECLTRIVDNFMFEEFMNDGVVFNEEENKKENK